jgi:hypothetical protein
MKTKLSIVQLLMFSLFIHFAVNAQDTIFRKTGDRILCKIQKEDSSKVWVIIVKNGKAYSTFINKNEIQSIHYYKPSNVIILTNSLTGKTLEVHNHEKIKVVLRSDGKIVKGKLIAIKDSIIVLNNDSLIKIADIQDIYLKPPTFNEIIAGTLLAAGSFVFVTGVYSEILGIAIASNSVFFFPPAFGYLFIIVGIPITTLGCLLGIKGIILFGKRKYTTQDWNLKVISK